MKASIKKSNQYQSGNLILKQQQKQGALILGDCNSAMQKKFHKQYNIKTIISIGQQALPIKQKLPQNCKHYFYDIHDNKSQKISTQLFDQIIQIIQNGRINGGVLVHCYAGVSRSSTFVISYIMKKLNKNYQQAKQIVKKCRQCIYPNDQFVHQLKYYEKALIQREKQRIRKLQEEKQKLINDSIVNTARKSVRGGVKAAQTSPEKVKLINEAPKELIKQQKQQQQTQNLLIKVNSTQVNQKDQSKLKNQRSKQKIDNKMNSIKKQIIAKNIIKKPTQNQALIKKQIYSQKNIVKNQPNKNKNNEKVQQNKNKVNQKNSQNKNKRQEQTKIIKKQQVKHIKQQKPVLRNTSVTKKTQNITTDELLLTQKQKNVKKIYGTKVHVK